MALLAAPQGPATFVSGQCSVTVTGHLSAHQHADGGVTVQCGPQTRVTAYASSDGGVGAVHNLRGNVVEDGNPAHWLHVQQVPLPLAVVPEDTLHVWSAMGADRRGSYAFKDSGRSKVDQCMPVVFVSWQPGPGILRPPALGNSWLSRFFRSLPVHESLLDLSRLLSVIDTAAMPTPWNGKPTGTYCAGLFSRYCGEVYSGWHTDEFTPDHQNPGYGRDVAASVSLALLHSASKAPIEEKRAVALGLAQWGFDLVGAFADGRQGTANGGHTAGRKAPIVFLGHLLNLDPFIYPSAFLGPVFNEDQQFYPGQWWQGWSVRFAYNRGGNLDGRELANHPSTWTSDQKWSTQGYLNPCIGTQLGTVLAMRLMGRTEAFGTAIDQFAGYWMSPSAATVAQAAGTVGCRLDVGKCTSIGIAEGWQAEAWRRYAQ